MQDIADLTLDQADPAAGLEAGLVPGLVPGLEADLEDTRPITAAGGGLHLIPLGDAVIRETDATDLF